MRRTLLIPQHQLANPLTIATANPLPAGTQGTAYSQTFAASGGQGNYRWFLLHDYAGTGLSMSLGGVLSGTPAVSGLCTLVIAVADSGGGSAQMAFQIGVAPSAGLAITSSSPLPGATIGSPYSFTMSAVGGFPPYTWSIVSDTPDTGAWLSISSSGVLSGTPGTAETESLTIKVTDSSLATASAPFSLTVNPAASPGQLPTFILTPSAAGNTAWTFGHPFKQGDLPAGNTVAIGGVPIQTDIRNRWPDGSAKYAFLSAVTSLTSGPNALQLQATTSSPAGPNLSRPTIARNVYNVSLTVGTGSFPIAAPFAVDLADVLAVTATTWSTTLPSTPRTIPGPIMREDHFAYPTGLAQLVLFFYVRSYFGGAMEVEVTVQNGYLSKPGSVVGLPSPTEQDYTISVVLNGSTTLYTQSNVLHLGHTAAGRFDWVQGSAECIPQHDVAYLRSTKTVPNYGYTNPAPATLSQWVQDTTNMVSWFTPVAAPVTTWTTSGNHYGDMDWAYDAVGYHPVIGLMTQWEALYCTTGDAQAWRATIGNTYQWMQFAQSIIDETTGLCPDWRTYQTSGSGNWSIYRGPGPNIFPYPAGGIPPPNVIGGSWGNSDAFNPSHLPGTGYLAYILTGRWSFLTIAQQSAWCIVQDMQPKYTHGIGICQPAMDGGSRAGWWAARTVAYAASISPTSLNGTTPNAADLAVRQSFVDSLNHSASFLKTTYIWGTTPTILNGSDFKPNGTGFCGDGGYLTPGTGGFNVDGQQNCTVTAGSNVITYVGSHVDANNQWPPTPLAGWPIYNYLVSPAGSIPAGAVVTGTPVAGNPSITMSVNAPTSGSGQMMMPTNPATWWGSYWMYGFGGMCWALAADISPEGANLGDVYAVRNFVWLDRLTRFQGPKTELNQSWDFRRAAVSFSTPYVINTSWPSALQYAAPTMVAMASAYSEYKTAFQLIDANLTSSIPDRETDISLANTSTSDGFGGQGYGALTMSVLAVATEAGPFQASARYSYLTGYQDPYSTLNTAPANVAPNFLPQTQGASDAPQLSLAPRALTAPSWY